MIILISVFIAGKRKMALWPALHVVLLAEVSGSSHRLSTHLHRVL